jgi:hypothetical protein
MIVVLLGWHGKAVSARYEERVAANALRIEPTEEFDVVLDDSGRFGLRTVAGKFLTALPNGTVTADQTHPGDWERFRLVSASPGRFGILTAHQRYLSAQPAGGLEANRTWLRDWEQFLVHRLSTTDDFGRSTTFSAPELDVSVIFERGLADPEEAARQTLSVVPKLFEDPFRAGGSG